MNRRESVQTISYTLLGLLVGGRSGLAAVATNTKRQLTVYKSATCGCCKAWVEHARKSGFVVNAIDVEDVTPYKKQFGVPLDLASCHTAVVDKYVFEGHVPADLIERLLVERPKGAKGLAVPGMPVGSPGMEVGNRKDAYDVMLFDERGAHRVWAKR
jgi:hypothetical protein